MEAKEQDYHKDLEESNSSDTTLKILMQATISYILNKARGLDTQAIEAAGNKRTQVSNPTAIYDSTLQAIKEFVSKTTNNAYQAIDTSRATLATSIDVNALKNIIIAAKAKTGWPKEKFKNFLTDLGRLYILPDSSIKVMRRA